MSQDGRIVTECDRCKSTSFGLGIEVSGAVTAICGECHNSTVLQHATAPEVATGTGEDDSTPVELPEMMSCCGQPFGSLHMGGCSLWRPGLRRLVPLGQLRALLAGRQQVTTATADEIIEACAKLAHENLSSQCKSIWKAGNIENHDAVSCAMDELLPRIRALKSKFTVAPAAPLVVCGSLYPRDGRTCERSRGHDGDHATSGMGFWWSDATLAPATPDYRNTPEWKARCDNNPPGGPCCERPGCLRDPTMHAHHGCNPESHPAAPDAIGATWDAAVAECVAAAKAWDWSAPWAAPRSTLPDAIRAVLTKG